MADGERPRTRAQQLGDAAERFAERHLNRAGLRTVERNWHCRAGELDLIMRDGETLVFVEVRRRRRGRHGTAAESIGPRKRQRLVRAAQRYLQGIAGAPPCRFDVIAIDEAVGAAGGAADPRRERAGTGRFDVHWIRAAFDAA